MTIMWVKELGSHATGVLWLIYSKASVMKMIFMKKLGVFVMTYLQLDQTDPDNQYWKQKKGR